MGLMEPAEEEADQPEGEKKKMVDADIDIPPQPIVIVSTHNDLKKVLKPRPLASNSPDIDFTVQSRP